MHLRSSVESFDVQHSPIASHDVSSKQCLVCSHVLGSATSLWVGYQGGGGNGFEEGKCPAELSPNRGSQGDGLKQLLLSNPHVWYYYIAQKYIYIYNWNPRCFLGLLSFSASRRTSTSMIWSTPWWNTLLARVTYHRFFQRTVGKEQYHLRFVLQNLWISTLRPAWRYLLTLDMWFIHMDLNYCRLHALACKGWQFFLLYRALRAPSIWWRLCVHLGQEYQEGLPCERRWMCLVIWAGTLLLQQTWWFQGAKTEFNIDIMIYISCFDCILKKWGLSASSGAGWWWSC